MVKSEGRFAANSLLEEGKGKDSKVLQAAVFFINCLRFIVIYEYIKLGGQANNKKDEDYSWRHTIFCLKLI